MRPVRLELEGFTAFRDRVEVDLEGAELFVLCGPTGSGKSSLIDAICFALYGSVPRYNDPGLVHPVISQGRLEARVRFDFTVNGSAYSAVRVVRRTRQGAQTREARLESEGNVLAGSVRELDEQVRELFGLSFDQFTTCVVLPQGQFARFMHGTPGERQALLKELLGLRVYDRMRGLAAGRGEAAKQLVARLEGQLERSARATPAARREWKERRATLERLAKRVDETQAIVDRLCARGREAAEEAERHRASLKRLEGVRAPSGAEGLGRDRSAAARELKSSERQRAAAEKALTTAERARGALADPAETRKLLDMRAEREGKQQELAAARKRERETKAAHERAAARAERARDAAAAARARSEEILMIHAAHHLASGLERGDPCPVCRRPIERKPRRARQPDLDEIKRRVATVEREQRRAEDAAQSAFGSHTEQTTRVRELSGAVRRLGGALRGAPARNRLESALRAVGEAEHAIGRQRAELELARKAEALARRRLDQLVERAGAAWGDLDAARDGLAGLDPPAADRDDLAGSWRALVAWAAARAAGEREKADAATAAADDAAVERAQRLEEIGRHCREAGVDASDDRPRDAVLAALVRTEQQIERIDQEIETARELTAELAEARTRQAVAASLLRHLSAYHFERWLLEEAFVRLVGAASGRLRELSDGDYSFQVDPRLNFEIVDHRNADEVRSARTLSGGETFLASLALAMTLADQVAELAVDGAVRLDSMFLDEGFGTLDTDALETVAGTIEALGARGRTVGLVTHVRELAERIPVQYRVRKGPRTSTVEKFVL